MNILFTCAGRRTYLLKYFKENLAEGDKVVATDMQLSAPALQMADVKIQVPAVYDPEYVNVTLKSYRDMISVYGFDANQVEMLEQIMSPEFMGQLGYAGSGSGGGGGSPGVSSMTEDEINAILNEITDSRQKTVCSYALHRVGFPYSQDLRDSGNYYDCSSLAYYSWKDAGVDISYGGATTAAAEAQGLDEAGKTVSFDELQPGDLIFYSFTSNGRYKNISHVAVYVGNGKVVEALNESLGVVYRDVASTGKIVVIGRP